eukprot:Skav224766  [mRNA]  locus=scaffold1604:509334:521780:+ [translate_table: standard]
MAACLLSGEFGDVGGSCQSARSAYDPMFPIVDQKATAFSGLSDQLKMAGRGRTRSIDLLKGGLMPKLSTKNVVRAGECASDTGRNEGVAICITACLMGMLCTSEQMGTMIVFQGGMLMQLLPAFGLGLYFPINEVAVSGGIITGLVSLVVVLIAGNPVEDYVPSVYVSAAMNFLCVATLHVICWALSWQSAPSKKQGLSITDIRDAMSTYGTPGEQEPIIYGLPRWGLFQLAAFVMMFFVGAVACALWKPPPPAPAVPPAVADPFWDAKITGVVSEVAAES